MGCCFWFFLGGRVLFLTSCEVGLLLVLCFSAVFCILNVPLCFCGRVVFFLTGIILCGDRLCSLW